MARSYRKTPIFGITTAASDAAWKAKAARRFRHVSRMELAAQTDSDLLPVKRWSVVNPWSAPKDGKSWWRGATKRHLTK